MLSEAEAKRRIEAARTLRGLTQDALDAMGYRDGLGKQELSRAERGELEITRVRREVFARLLGLPIEWFESDSIDDLIRWPASGIAPDQIKRAAELLGPQLLEAARALAQASEQERRAPGAQGPPTAGGEADGG